MSYYKVGLHSVGSYQVSGKPFVSGGLDAASAAISISFPMVTRWIQVNNSGSADLKGGVSVLAGLTGVGVESIDNSSVSPSSPNVNWSGSSGVG